MQSRQITDPQSVELRNALAAAEWQIFGRSRDAVSQRSWLVSALAAACTVFMHAILLAPAMLQIAGSEREQSVVGSSDLKTGTTGESTLVFVATSQSVSEEASLDFASLENTLSLLSTQIANPAPNAPLNIAADSTENNATAEGINHDGSQLAALFGRYMNQLQARINRAWMRPRTKIGADRFECGARIEQDRSGRVQSIELINCNGDARWQRSLVSGIRLASPLSAPPEPTVYTPTLLMQFEAREYEPGVSRESEYEPAALSAAVRHSTSSSDPAINGEPNFDDIRTHSGNIKLTISGSTTTWELTEEAPDQDRNAAGYSSREK